MFAILGVTTISAVVCLVTAWFAFFRCRGSQKDSVET
jgi:hypothetical protein